VVKISPECVTGPQQDKSSDGIVTISLWTIKASDARRITVAEMKYMRRTTGHTGTDYKTNEQIAKELKMTSVMDKLLEYMRKWVQHLNRML